MSGVVELSVGLGMGGSWDGGFNNLSLFKEKKKITLHSTRCL